MFFLHLTFKIMVSFNGTALNRKEWLKNTIKHGLLLQLITHVMQNNYTELYMKWIATLPFFLLLSACIYTEGTPIIEPQDVVVSPYVYQLVPCEQCGTVDVTNAT